MPFAVAVKITAPTFISSHSEIDCHCDYLNVLWVTFDRNLKSIVPPYLIWNDSLRDSFTS